MCPTCVQGLWGQKKVSGPLKPEFQGGVSHHVGLATEKQQGLSTAKLFLHLPARAIWKTVKRDNPDK